MAYTNHRVPWDHLHLTVYLYGEEVKAASLRLCVNAAGSTDI